MTQRRPKLGEDFGGQLVDDLLTLSPSEIKQLIHCIRQLSYRDIQKLQTTLKLLLQEM